tara:strand:- start:146 stop:619 length:474 start_codon:yes stop_codon:yes gene_type:complete
MNNKTIKEVLINDSIKITNRKVILINQDKETNKIKNFVYLDIINEGLDFLEETYGDYDACDGDVKFCKKVVKEIKRIRKQLKEDSSIDLKDSFSCNVVNISLDYYMEDFEDTCIKDPKIELDNNLWMLASQRLQYVIQDIWGVGIMNHLKWVENENS